MSDLSGVFRFDLRVYEFLYGRREFGATFSDVSHFFDVHHGQSSGALSRLHKPGHIFRLEEKRENRSVYVLPAFAGARRTIPHGSVLAPKPLVEFAAEVVSLLDRGQVDVVRRRAREIVRTGLQ